MKLWPHILKVHHAINVVTSSPLIAYLTQQRTQEIESFTFRRDQDADHFVEGAVRELQRTAIACAKNIEAVSEQLRLKNTFAELLVFVRLLKRCPSLQRIPETDTKTPDFKDRDSRFFIEFKSLNQFGGHLNHRRAMEEGLDGKVKIEGQVKEGRRFASALQVVQPWFNPSSKTKYDPDSIAYLSESLVEKVVQNIKPDQFAHGPTLLFLDMSQLILPGRKRQLLAKEVISGQTGENYSGLLWHAAFGRPGMAMKRIIDFEGQDNTDRPLRCTGILRQFDFIQGMIVHYDDRFLGLAIRQKNKLKDTLKAVQYIEKICDDSVFENAGKNRRS